MSLWHAFICGVFFVGCCAIAYVIGDFIKHYRHHRWVARNRRKYYRVIGKPQPDSRDWLQAFKDGELRR